MRHQVDEPETHGRGSPDKPRQRHFIDSFSIPSCKKVGTTKRKRKPTPSRLAKRYVDPNRVTPRTGPDSPK